MARAPGDDDAFPLSPRARRIAGWVAAALLIVGIAIGVRLFGGNDDGTAAESSPPASTTPGAATITFGTALDAATGEVASDARTDRFAEGDDFVYSVPPTASVPPAIFVEVLRTEGDVAVLQEPVDAQRLPNPEVIAFSVPTAALLADFGPGRFRMVIYADPAGGPIAEGIFELVGPPASPVVSP